MPIYNSPLVLPSNRKVNRSRASAMLLFTFYENLSLAELHIFQWDITT